MFSLEHIIFLIIGFGISIPLGIFVGIKKYDVKKVLLISMLVYLPFEIVKMGVYISWGFPQLKYSLPFHLCSIHIFSIPILFFSRNEKFKNIILSFFLPSSLLGGALALILNTVIGGNGAFSTINFQYNISHNLLLFLSIFLCIAYKDKINTKTYITGTITLGLLAYVVFNLNIIGSTDTVILNFFYLMYPPMDGLPFLNMNQGHAVYILKLMLLALVLFTAFYSPFIIRDIKNHVNKEKTSIDMDNNL